MNECQMNNFLICEGQEEVNSRLSAGFICKLLLPEGSLINFYWSMLSFKDTIFTRIWI